MKDERKKEREGEGERERKIAERIDCRAVLSLGAPS
jgi:hypothetical protein